MSQRKIERCRGNGVVAGKEAMSTAKEEWTIYPAGFDSRFALGSPDGRVLRDGEYVEVMLNGSWHTGWIEQASRLEARFVSHGDKSTCGLCAGMQVRLPGQRLIDGTSLKGRRSHE